MNGDGLIDIVWYMQSTDFLFGEIGFVPIQVQKVFLNTGSGWVTDGARAGTLDDAGVMPFVIDSQLQGYDLIDVNSDGLADVVRTRANAQQVFLNDGAGWQLDAIFTASIAGTAIISLASQTPQGLLPSDLNGDGLIDFIRADEGTMQVFRNTGLGWVVDPTLTANLVSLGVILADEDGKPQGVSFSDVDGDGLSDLLVGKQDGEHSIRRGRGPVADLLVMATTLLGETTRIVYGASSQFDNRGDDAIHDLPLVMPVVLSLTRGDGRGHHFTSTYDYEGGKFDTEGGYRGFARTDMTDPRGVVARTRQNQVGPLAGTVTRTEIREAGVVRERHSFTYDAVAAVPGVTQIRLRQTDVETFDTGGSTHLRTRIDYDAYVNISEVHKDGDVATIGDETRTTITHVLNTAAGITGPPARISVYDAGGVLVSKSVILYDGLPVGTVDKGNPTAMIDTVEIGGATTTRSAEYDVYGNVVRARDRGGAELAIEYDPVRHTHAVRSRDAGGRVVTTEHDPRFAAVVRDVDANGHATTRAYDAFGRLTQEIRPGDECSPNGTISVIYSPLGDATVQHMIVRATERPGEAATFDTTSFVDGFGQIHRVAGEGHGGRTVLVDTEFDDAGNARSVTRPYFAGDSAPVTTFERDALHRSIRTTDPDGIPHTISYAGTERHVTDKRGNTIDLVYDAYQHVVKMTQHTGGDDLVTRYGYDAFGRVIQVRNALGEVTAIAYDALGRRTRIEDPALGPVHYEYDQTGNLIRQLDAAGRSIHFTYDENNQLVRRTLSTGQVAEYSYDGPTGSNSVARVARIVDEAGTLGLRYDPRGHVVERRRTVGLDTYVTGYHYDSMDRLAQVDYPDGFRAMYEYGRAGFATRIVDGEGRPIVDTVAYDATGQITNIRYGNGVSSRYTYNARASLAATRTEGPGGILVILIIAAVVITAFGIPVGPVLAAAALGGLVGAGIGLGVGLILGMVLLIAGEIQGPGDFFAFVGALAITGFLVGAALGAVIAGGLAATATVTAKLATSTVVGSAGGALAGGAFVVVNEGSATDLLRGVIYGAGVGAVVGFGTGLTAVIGGSVAAPGFLGKFGPALFVVGRSLYIAGLAAVSGYFLAEECVDRNCSPFDQTGSASFGEGGALDGLGATGALGDFVRDTRGIPHWTFLGTLVHRLLYYDVETRQELRDTFNAYPMVP